jgi:hypothetical protein
MNESWRAVQSSALIDGEVVLHPGSYASLLICALSEPASTHQMSNSERVRLVGLVALRRHRGADMERLQASHNRQAKLLQFRMQPRRQ